MLKAIREQLGMRNSLLAIFLFVGIGMLLVDL